MRPRAGRLAACLVHQTGARSEHKFAHTPCIRMDTITLAVADDIQSRAGSVGKVENGGTRSSALGVEGMVASRWRCWSRPQAEPIFACPRCLFCPLDVSLGDVGDVGCLQEVRCVLGDPNRAVRLGRQATACIPIARPRWRKAAAAALAAAF